MDILLLSAVSIDFHSCLTAKCISNYVKQCYIFTLNEDHFGENISGFSLTPGLCLKHSWRKISE